RSRDPFARVDEAQVVPSVAVGVAEPYCSPDRLELRLPGERVDQRIGLARAQLRAPDPGSTGRQTPIRVDEDDVAHTVAVDVRRAAHRLRVEPEPDRTTVPARAGDPGVARGSPVPRSEVGDPVPIQIGQRSDQSRHLESIRITGDGVQVNARPTGVGTEAPGRKRGALSGLALADHDVTHPVAIEISDGSDRVPVAEPRLGRYRVAAPLVQQALCGCIGYRRTE